MRYFLCFVFFSAVLLSAGCFAFGGSVPPVTAADFGGAVLVAGSAEAHPIWLILAGQGPLGAILLLIAGWAYKALRPCVLAWLEARKLDKLYLAGEAVVTDINVTYVEGIKAASADGKLTEDEKKFVFQQCKDRFVVIMKAQGVDIVKEYGDHFVNALIELLVSRLKIPVAAKAVAAPLSASESGPMSAPIPELLE